MKPLRVLHLINDLRADGGAETALAHLARHLDRGQIELWVASLFARGRLEQQLALPPERVVCFDFSRNFYLAGAAFRRLVGFLRRERIQILHTHLFEANTVGRIAGWLAGVPVLVATEHNTYVNKSFHCILLDHLLAGVTHQLVAVSEAVRSFAARQARIPPQRFVVIPNGLSLDEIPRLSAEERRQKRASLGIRPEQPLVVAVGRLTEQKGYPVLLKAAPAVLAQFPDAVFLIVGAGKLEAELRRQVVEAHLTGSIRFLGQRSDVPELLQASTLLALPSYWEGLPMVLLEAGACGLPVVASDVGGVAEIVKPGETGVLVPPGNAQALAQTICRLLASAETCRQMGARARLWIEERFVAQRVAEQLQALYRQLFLSQQGSGAGAVSAQVAKRKLGP